MSKAISQALELDVTRFACIVLVVCLCSEILFVVADYYINYGKLTKIGSIRRMFNIAREDGLASWFASTQSLLAGLTLWLIFILSKNTPQPVWKSIGWFMIALFFTYMAVDDGAQVHERLATAYERINENTSLFPSYSWQFLFVPALGAFGVFMLIFLWIELQERYSHSLILAAIMCLVIALALDFIEGLEEEHPWNIYTWLANQLDIDAWTQERFDKSALATIIHFAKSFEETLEMIANSLFWFVFLRHIPAAAGDMQIQFK